MLALQIFFLLVFPVHATDLCSTTTTYRSTDSQQKMKFWKKRHSNASQCQSRKKNESLKATSGSVSGSCGISELFASTRQKVQRAFEQTTKGNPAVVKVQEPESALKNDDGSFEDYVRRILRESTLDTVREASQSRRSRLVEKIKNRFFRKEFVRDQNYEFESPQDFSYLTFVNPYYVHEKPAFLPPPPEPLDGPKSAYQELNRFKRTLPFATRKAYERKYRQARMKVAKHKNYTVREFLILMRLMKRVNLWIASEMLVRYTKTMLSEGKVSSTKYVVTIPRVEFCEMFNAEQARKKQAQALQNTILINCEDKSIGEVLTKPKTVSKYSEAKTKWVKPQPQTPMQRKKIYLSPAEKFEKTYLSLQTPDTQAVTTKGSHSTKHSQEPQMPSDTSKRSAGNAKIFPRIPGPFGPVEWWDSLAQSRAPVEVPHLVETTSENECMSDEIATETNKKIWYIKERDCMSNQIVNLPLETDIGFFEKVMPWEPPRELGPPPRIEFKEYWPDQPALMVGTRFTIPRIEPKKSCFKPGKSVGWQYKSTLFVVAPPPALRIYCCDSDCLESSWDSICDFDPWQYDWNHQIRIVGENEPFEVSS